MRIPHESARYLRRGFHDHHGRPRTQRKRRDLDARRPRRAPPRKPPPAPSRNAERHRREPLRPGERHGEALPPVSQPLHHPGAPGRGAGTRPPERPGRESGGRCQRRRRDLPRLRPGPRRAHLDGPHGEQVRLGDGRVLPAADQAPRNGRGRGDGACPVSEPLPRLGPMQCLLQERLYPCGQQGRSEGEDRGGPVPDDGGQDRRDPPPGAPARHHGHRRHGAKRRRHGLPAQGNQKPPGPRRGALLRGPGRSTLGPRKRNGPVPGRRKALPQRGELLCVPAAPGGLP